MAELVYVLGESGTGKSFGIRTLDPNSTVIISVTPKTFTFDHSFTYLDSKNKKGNYAVIRSVDEIITSLKFIEKNMLNIKTYVIDDFTYIQSFEYFKRIHAKNYDRFNEVGDVFYKLIEFLMYEIDRTKIVFLLGHTMVETLSDGTKITKMKTIGNLIDKLLVSNGLSNNVFGTEVERLDNEANYCFITQNGGNDIFKSAFNCHFDYKIPNDLEFVRQKIDSTIIK